MVGPEWEMRKAGSIAFGDPADALSDESAEVRVGVTAVADDGADDAGFFLGAIPREPFIAVFQQDGGVGEQVHVAVEFVVQHKIVQAGGDGVVRIDDGDGDVHIAFIGGGGDAVGHLFIEVDVFAAGDAFVLAPHGIGEVGVVEDDDADALFEEFQEAGFLFIRNIAWRVIKEHDIVGVEVGSVVSLGGFELFGGGERDFGVILEHLEERGGFEAVTAGEDEHLDFLFGGRMGGGAADGEVRSKKR